MFSDILHQSVGLLLPAFLMASMLSLGLGLTVQHTAFRVGIPLFACAAGVEAGHIEGQLMTTRGWVNDAI